LSRLHPIRAFYSERDEKCFYPLGDDTAAINPKYCERVDAEITAVCLSADMLSILSAEFRQELRHVLISLDPAQIAATIRQIADIEAKLALALSQLAEYFDYPAILKCLDEIKDR